MPMTATQATTAPTNLAPAGAIHMASVDTPRGSLHVAYRRGRILRTAFHRTAEAFARDLQRDFGPSPAQAATLPPEIARAVRQALAGRLDPDTIDWSGLSPFQQRVLIATAAIPAGHTRAYGELAAEAGSPGAARAVGNTMARNPYPLLIPCHRVVRADGEIGAYGAGGAEVKRRLLRAEGVAC